MTVVHLHVVDYPDVFWDKCGEVVSSVELWREISGARPRMFGGKVVSPPHSGFCVLTGIDNKLTVCQ